MIAKTYAKETAIKLRKRGKTYSEILAEVPVAKSTLSLWLREVGLSRAQQHTITQRKLDAQRRGGAARKRMRQDQTQEIFRKAISEVGILSPRERLLLGAALYWAEGSKEKSGKTGSGD